MVDSSAPLLIIEFNTDTYLDLKPGIIIPENNNMHEYWLRPSLDLSSNIACAFLNNLQLKLFNTHLFIPNPGAVMYTLNIQKSSVVSRGYPFSKDSITSSQSTRNSMQPK